MLALAVHNATVPSYSRLPVSIAELTAYLCPPSESPTVFCTRSFWLSEAGTSLASNVQLGFCLLVVGIQFASMLSPRISALFSSFVMLPLSVIDYCPALLRSYIVSGSFTFTIHAPFSFIFLSMFYKSGIPYSERWAASHIFTMIIGGKNASTAVKRTFFPLVWVCSVCWQTGLTGLNKECGMLNNMMLSILALLVPLFGYGLGNRKDALALQVRSLEIGDGPWQGGEVLGYIVGRIPKEHLRSARTSALAYAGWFYMAIFIGIVRAQGVVTMSWPNKTPTTDASWTRWIPLMHFQWPQPTFLYGIPLAFTFSLLLALLAMYCAQTLRWTDGKCRLLSSACASFCLALILRRLDIPCTWAAWAYNDAILWAVDAWWMRRQTRMLRNEFAHVVASRAAMLKTGKIERMHGGGFVSSRDGKRDMYEEDELLDP